MAKLLEAREQLSNLLRYMDGKVAAEDTLKKLLADPQLMAAMKSKLEPEAVRKTARRNKGRTRWLRRWNNSKVRRQPPALAEADEFAAMLKQNFKPRSDRAASEVENAVQTLVTQALADSSAGQERRHRHDRGDDRPPRRKAFGADERGAARARVPATRERVARPALPRLQLRDRRDPEDPRDQRRQDASSIAISSSIPARAGIRARCSRRSTKASSVSSAASPMARWSRTITSAIRRPTCSCCAISRRSPRRRWRR